MQEEVEWIENSGEIPEVAFYAAFSYLTEKEDGPKLTLTASDIKHLEDAVINRYKIIIMRDLNYANRGSHTFRGMERAIVNYGRLKKYLVQKNRVVSGWKEEVGQSLLNYINREYHDISKGRLYGTINCTREKLERFARELDVDINSHYLDVCFKEISLTFDEVYRATLLTEREDYPFKFLCDRGDCFEIVIFNKNKQQFSISLKILCGCGEAERQKMWSKADAIYRSISKSPIPWDHHSHVSLDKNGEFLINKAKGD